jgi:hypothetical protein
MRIVWAFVLLVIVMVDPVAAKSCAALTQELARMRQEYHDYASGKSKTSGEVTFDGLVAILDKIVALKNEMRKSDCKIPPRLKRSSEKSK